ncbi:hypothetical protein ACEG17_05455 [Leptotrichia hongkongensis]|uniref:Uncharacterized protein n=1 Tax=Leptotrichia hongkongensis TaxID=554406 RepID=A0ABV4S730_9FUSO
MKFSTIRNKILILLVFVATFITGYSDDIKLGWSVDMLLSTGFKMTLKMVL